MMNSKPDDELGSEYVFQKLGKSIVANTDLYGDVLNLDNLSGIIFNNQHTPVRDSHKVIGKN